MTYDEQVVADGASAYWRLNDTSGTVATDSIGTAHGTITGGVTLGQPGPLADGSPAMAFDGSTGYIQLTLGSHLDIGTGPVSVECWLRATSPVADTYPLRFGWLSAPGLVMSTAAGALYFIVYTSAGTTYLVKSFEWADSQWHHLVGVVERGASDRARFYVDGTEAYSEFLPAAGINLTPATAPTIASLYGASNCFAGTLDEVAFYKLALTPAQIANHYALRTYVPTPPPLAIMPGVAVQLEPDVWTDLIPDVIASAGIRATRGISGSGPMDRVATPGILTFTLRNDAGNSGGTLGWYSPDYVGVRSGWTPGIPIRLTLTYATTTVTAWTGRIRTIAPEAGRYLSRYVEVTAQDVMADLTETIVRRIPAQIDQTEAQLIEAVVAALPASVQPPLDLDPGLDTLAYVFDDIGDGAPALQLLHDVVAASFGTLVVDRDGTLVYRNRQVQSQTDVSAAFTEADLSIDDGLVVQAGLGNVYNRVRATVHPRSLGTAATDVLYAATGVIAVPPGGTVTIWGSYAASGNTERLIGGTDFQIPIVADTDYHANSSPTGGAAILTGEVGIVTTAFASGAEFVITNSSPVYTAYFVDVSGTPHLQLRGRAIADNAPLTVEAVSAQDYGDRLLEMDLKYQDDAAVAQSMVDYVHSLYQQPTHRVVKVGLSLRSAALLEATLTMRIGDVVTVSEPVTGLTDPIPVVIRGMEWAISPGRPSHAQCWWTVAPSAIAAQLWVLNDPVASILDDTTVLGWA